MDMPLEQQVHGRHFFRPGALEFDPGTLDRERAAAGAYSLAPEGSGGFGGEGFRELGDFEDVDPSHLAGLLALESEHLNPHTSQAIFQSLARSNPISLSKHPASFQTPPLPVSQAGGVVSDPDVSSLAAFLDRQLMLSASAPAGYTGLLSDGLMYEGMGPLSTTVHGNPSRNYLHGVAEDEIFDEFELGSDISSGHSQQVLDTWQSFLASGKFPMSGNGQGSQHGGQALQSGLASPSEHPFGEHPSRTLFVRNINWSVEESEIRSIFEEHGEIRAVYTACKHRGFVMVSYYDLRSAKAAMRALQGRVLRRRRLDIHYSIPKDNPNDKDVNQGTLVVFNLDPTVTNEELYQIFSQCGEVKEIRETPKKRNHKFIEYFDVRAAAKALQLLNHTEVNGKRIKLEPSRPGGARRTVAQQWMPEEEEKLTTMLSANQPWNIPQASHRRALDHFDAGNLPSHFSAPAMSQLLQIPGNPLSIDMESPNTSLHGPQSSSTESSSLGSLSTSLHHQSHIVSSQMPAGSLGISSSGILHRAGSGSGLRNPAPSGIGMLSHSLQSSVSGSSSMHSQNHHYQSASIGNAWPYDLMLGHDAASGPVDLNQQVFGPGKSHGMLNPQEQLRSGTPININGMSSSHQPQQTPPSPQYFIGSATPESLPGANMFGFQEHMNSSGHNTFSQGFPMAAGLARHSDAGSAPSLSDLAWQHRQNQRGIGQSASAADLLGLNVASQMSLDSHMLLRSALATNAGLTELLKQLSSNPALGFNHHVGDGHQQSDRYDRSFNRNHRRSSTTVVDAAAEAHRKAQQERMYSLDLMKVANGEDKRTTLMIKNIPNKYTQKMLLATIDEFLSRSYDFFYLPIDFKNRCNMGYAFINMVAPRYILPLVERLNNKKWEKFNSEKVACISYARIQGKAALVSHFQNSSLMHEDKHCRPIIFASDGIVAGIQEPFPVGPNIRVRASRTGRDSRKGSMVNLQAHDEAESTDIPLCGSI